MQATFTSSSFLTLNPPYGLLPKKNNLEQLGIHPPEAMHRLRLSDHRQHFPGIHPGISMGLPCNFLRNSRHFIEQVDTQDEGGEPGLNDLQRNGKS
jgi:hypothetical protein